MPFCVFYDHCSWSASQDGLQRLGLVLTKLQAASFFLPFGLLYLYNGAKKSQKGPKKSHIWIHFYTFIFAPYFCKKSIATFRYKFEVTKEITWMRLKKSFGRIVWFTTNIWYIFGHFTHFFCGISYFWVRFMGGTELSCPGLTSFLLGPLPFPLQYDNMW